MTKRLAWCLKLTATLSLCGLAVILVTSNFRFFNLPVNRESHHTSIILPAYVTRSQDYNQQSTNISPVLDLDPASEQDLNPDQPSGERDQLDTQNNLEALALDLSLSEPRQRFLLWDQVNPEVTEAIGADVESVKTKDYLIYRCDNFNMSVCGGLADRIKGMILGYLIANLTGRIFKSQLLKSGCGLDQHLVPNKYNWVSSTNVHSKLNELQKDSRVLNLILKSSLFYEQVSSINFTALLGPARYVYFKANLDYSLGLRESKIYGHQLAWMRLASPHQVQATIYRRLFKLAPPLQTRLQKLLARELPSSEHRLICAHIRMGKNPTIPYDDEVRVGVNELESVWSFISNQSSSDVDRVFIMADSEEVMKMSRLQSFTSRQITTPGVIMHVELTGPREAKEVCSAQEKLIFDLHLLMNCDVLLVSHSGLSRLAAYVRGIDQGLYCLLHGGNIMPCTMQELKTIYHVKG